VRPKILIVLTNLGGPDSLKAVRPFLFNLFYDRAILRLPNPLRFLLAVFISLKRSKKSKEIYSLMGGRSPILKNTLEQARALKKSLEKDFEVLVVPAMRYWRPRAKDVLEVLEGFNPSKVVLLPLYPQFSTTTTLSSIEEWKRVAPQWQAKTMIRCCYFGDPDFIQAHQKLISPILEEAATHGVPRILFSAHGLPKKIVDDGDPYQDQIEATVTSIMKNFKNIDYVICYQSRVGSLEWIGPSIDEELKRAAKHNKAVVVVPVSFVSEHSETLVELDIDYAKKAKEWGISFYGRVPALGCDPSYIKCLENSARLLIEGGSILGQGCSGCSCLLTQECY